MSPVRPDLVDTWVFRDGPAADPADREILLLRRGPAKMFPGLWQCVSGSLEPGERIAVGALREVAEETGIAGSAIEAFYDLDLVNHFHEPSIDGLLSSAVFAVRVGRNVVPVLSPEHDAARWERIDDAHREVIWPGYRTPIERIRDDLADPERASWFELDLAGGRIRG